jgi:hypothetical protein
LTYDEVVNLAMRLPGVALVTGTRARALKVGGKLLARFRDEDATLVLRTSFAVRAYLMATAPSRFFLNDSYRDHPYVLVRLAAVSASDLAPLLEEAWRLVSPSHRTVADAPPLRRRPAEPTASSSRTPTAPRGRSRP